MKIKLFFRMMMCAVALFSFASCSNDDDNEFIIDPESTMFVGDFIVDQNDGTTFTDKDVKVSISFDLMSDKAIMIFHQAKFSPDMPVRLDMVLNGVGYSASTSEIRISGNKIIPVAMGGEFDEYIINGLVGRISPSEIMFSMTCGDFPVSYVGKIQ